MGFIMSKCKFETVAGVPAWAVCFFEYGDNSVMSDDDEKAARAFLDDLDRRGLRLACPVDGSSNDFNSRTAFGLACDTVDYWAAFTPARAAVAAFARSSRAYGREIGGDWCDVARIWNGGAGLGSFVHVSPDRGGSGGVVVVNMAYWRGGASGGDGRRLGSLLSALVAAGGSWRVLPVVVGYPDYYTVRGLSSRMAGGRFAAAVSRRDRSTVGAVAAAAGCVLVDPATAETGAGASSGVSE